jgi:hypothetical protein
MRKGRVNHNLGNLRRIGKLQKLQCSHKKSVLGINYSGLRKVEAANSSPEDGFQKVPPSGFFSHAP